MAHNERVVQPELFSDCADFILVQVLDWLDYQAFFNKSLDALDAVVGCLDCL